MTTIKKVFQPIIALLEENKEQKVKSILAKVIEMSQVKQTRDRVSKTYIKDVNGKVVAIRDFYFGRWMPLVGDKAVEFNPKKDSPTGYGSLSKLGQAKFSAAKNLAMKEERELLNRLMNGEVLSAEQIKEARDAIQHKRENPVVDETTPGFATIEEVIEYLAARKVKLPKEETAPVDKAA